MKTLLISLHGGRAVPTVSGALQIAPDVVKIVSSRDSDGPVGTLGHVTRALAHVEVSTIDQPACLVDPYSLEETTKAIHKVASSHPDFEIKVHLASAPLPMSLGAWQAVLELQSTRQIEACYNKSDGEMLWLSDGRTEQFKMSIRDYLKCYGWRHEKRQQRPVECVAPLLANDLVTTRSLLNKLRPAVASDNAGAHITLTGLQDQEASLLEGIASQEAFREFKLEGGTASFRLNTGWKQILLEGAWLEYHVYMAAKDAKDRDDRPLFDDCQWGHHIESRQPRVNYELDFIGIRQTQATIIECKDQQDHEKIKDHFDLLNSKAVSLGSDMCARIYVTTVFASDFDTQALKALRERAKQLKIVLVFGEDFNSISDVLKKVALNERGADGDSMVIYPRR